MPKKFITKESYYFVLAEYHNTKDRKEKTQNDINELNELLNEIGVKIEVNAPDENNIPILSIQINKDIYNKKITRNAGRNRKYDFSKDYTYGDIWRWRSEGIKESEILKRLGCTHATYARRLKEAKELEYEENTKWIG